MAQDHNDLESIKKLYYSISEVSDMLGVKPHVLRYWESQFGSLRPKKSRAGNRMYRDRDVETLRLIQELLHIRRYTIAGARRELSRMRSTSSTASVEPLERDASSLDGSSDPPAEAPAPDSTAPGVSMSPALDTSVSMRSATDAQGSESGGGGGRKPRPLTDPSQTALEVPRPVIPIAELADLRAEIAGLKEWLELVTKG